MCACVIFCKQPPSLKSAAYEIVFGIYNKQKFRFDNVTTCKPFEIHAIPEMPYYTFYCLKHKVLVDSRLISAMKIENSSGPTVLKQNAVLPSRPANNNNLRYYLRYLLAIAVCATAFLVPVSADLVYSSKCLSYKSFLIIAHTGAIR